MMVPLKRQDCTNLEHNLPYIVKVEEERNEEGYQLYHFRPVDKKSYLETQQASAEDPHPVVKQTQGRVNAFNLASVEAQYERIKTASPEERQGLYREFFGLRPRKQSRPDIREIEEIIPLP